MSKLIKQMAHVGLHVPDIDASVAWATTVMGMREVEREGGVSYLTHADEHHSLQFYQSDRSALDHIAMEAHGEAEIDELTRRLEAAGTDILSTEPEELGISRAIRFRGPDGHVFEVFAGMEKSGPIHSGSGVQPRKFGHPTLTCSDIIPTKEMLEEVLDFRLSDAIGDGILAWLRCNPDHHGIGLQKGEPGLNHYAWEVENLSELGRLGETLVRHDERFIWGPGRHGAGGNLFTYHYDPAGSVVEYYADMYVVLDERGYEPTWWSMEDYQAQNLWGLVTPDELLEMATPLASLPLRIEH